MGQYVGLPLFIHSKSPDATTPLLDVIHRVRVVRDSVIGRGQPNFSSSYADLASQESFKAHKGVEILFNYMGAYQQLETEESLFERDISQEVPNQVASHAKRVGVLEASAWVHQGQLVFRLERHNRLDKMQDKFNLETAISQLQKSDKVLFGLQSTTLCDIEKIHTAQRLSPAI